MPDPNGKFRAMGLPVDQTSKSPALTRTKVLFFIGFVAVCAAMATTFYWFRVPGEEFDLDVWYGFVAAGATLVVTVGGIFLAAWWNDRTRLGESQARQRVREAEDDFAAESRDDGLTLSALWKVTHERMKLYHEIVTGHARISFGSAQAAMIIGFVLLTAFAFLATEAKTTAAAVSAGALGAVGTAFSGYIARTFIRSQESAASHLRAYFDQPLELSRYLAAERLLANAGDLTAEQRADILSSLVGAIATSGQQDVSTKTKQAHGQAV